MKSGYLFCILLLAYFNICRAQDKIITTQNDTIHCRIISASDDRISYEIPGMGETVIGRSLPSDQVVEYHRGTKAQAPSFNAINIPKRRWRFGLQTGVSYMLASTTDAENSFVEMGTSKKAAEEFYDDLRSGYLFGTDVHFMVRDTWGFGLTYSLFATQAKSPLVLYTGDMINYWNMEMEERMYVSFVGVSFCLHQWLNRTHNLRLGQKLALGYVHYRDEVEFQRNSFIQPNNGLATGNSLGAGAEISLEYFPVSWLSVTGSIDFFGSWLRKMTISDGYNEQEVKLKDAELDNENLSRLNFSIGVRFHVK